MYIKWCWLCKLNTFASSHIKAQPLKINWTWNSVTSYRSEWIFTQWNAKVEWSLCIHCVCVMCWGRVCAPILQFIPSQAKMDLFTIAYSMPESRTSTSLSSDRFYAQHTFNAMISCVNRSSFSIHQANWHQHKQIVPYPLPLNVWIESVLRGPNKFTYKLFRN